MFKIETDQSNPFGQIIQMLLLRQNGVTAASLKQSGTVYKTNLGVSITDLRKIASRFEKDNQLAIRLWNHRWRETMLIATLISNPTTLDRQIIDLWTKNAHTLELAEALAMYLLVDYPQFDDAMPDWLHHSNEYCAIACFNTICKRISKHKIIDSKTVTQFIELVEAKEKSNSYILAASRAFSFVLRNNLQYKNPIFAKVEMLEKTDNRWSTAREILNTELNFG